MFLMLELISYKRTNNSRFPLFLFAVFKAWLPAWFYCFILLLVEEGELNPGKNTILPRHFQLYSKEYSDTPCNDYNLENSGYNLGCSDHPFNNKRGNTYIYYRLFTFKNFQFSRWTRKKLFLNLNWGQKLWHYISITLKLSLKAPNQI